MKKKITTKQPLKGTLKEGTLKDRMNGQGAGRIIKAGKPQTSSK